jgi:hypothetical protein
MQIPDLVGFQVPFGLPIGASRRQHAALWQTDQGYERATPSHRNVSVAGKHPAICGAMFAQIEQNRSRSQQVANATKAVLATTVILTISALIGTQLLLVSRAAKASDGGSARDMITPSWG